MKSLKSLKSLSAVRSELHSVYVRHFTNATLVEGTLAGSNLSCRCLMVMTRNSPFENYLLGKLFGESFKRLRVRRMWIPSLKRLAKRPPRDVDFIVASLPAHWDQEFEGLHDLKSPPIVRQVLDLTGDWTDIKKRLNRKKREIFNGLMTTNRYSYRISKEPADFERFYHQMYLPHTKKQFRAAARVDSHASLKAKFAHGFLLILTEAGEDVAASLCYIEGNTMTFHRGGVLDGSEEHVKNGAQTVLYYFKVRYAKEQDLARLDLQHSRAFFDDGVYRHKREWGASVSVDDDIVSWMYLFDPKGSVQAETFLQKNPLIVATPEGLLGYYVSAKDAKAPGPKQSDLEKRYYAPGIGGMVVRSAGKRALSRLGFGSGARD